MFSLEQRNCQFVFVIRLRVLLISFFFITRIQTSIFTYICMLLCFVFVEKPFVSSLVPNEPYQAPIDQILMSFQSSFNVASKTSLAITYSQTCHESRHMLHTPLISETDDIFSHKNSDLILATTYQQIMSSNLP